MRGLTPRSGQKNASGSIAGSDYPFPDPPDRPVLPVFQQGFPENLFPALDFLIGRVCTENNRPVQSCSARGHGSGAGFWFWREGPGNVVQEASVMEVAGHFPAGLLTFRKGTLSSYLTIPLPYTPFPDFHAKTAALLHTFSKIPFSA
jgi:hypothetical protein